MNETEEQMCLENIEEYLMDHDKIVTYKYLSRSLNISMNDAKRLLAKYASTSKHKSDLSSVYAVGGELKNDGGFSVIIAQDEDLDSVKSQFKEVSWEQLYSLQKKGQLCDLNTLLIANNVTPTDENENSVVGIPYWKDPKRDDIAARNATTATTSTIAKQEPKVPPKKAPSPQKPAQPSKIPPKTLPKATPKSKTSPSPKKETSAKDKSTGNKSGGIAAMFAAQQSKKDTAPKSKAKPEPAKKSGSQSISSLFAGQAKKMADKKTESQSSVSSSCTSTDNSKLNCESQELFSSSDNEKGSQSTKSQESALKVNGKEGSSQSKKSQETAPKVNGKEGSSQSSKNASINKKPPVSKKKVQSQKGKKGKPSEPPQKRRKRVMVESDSENSSEGDSDAESERSLSPEPEKPPSPEPMEEDDEIIPATPVEPSKKRKRKAVDKTVMDENGFLCTTKEYVYESCSDNEENDENKKTIANSETKEAPKPEKSPEPKKVIKQPTKQVSLTSFFKKK
nr:PREDICTED: DNA polymerase delta subunit 3-like isoform X2 [Bemisia tabaci]